MDWETNDMPEGKMKFTEALYRPFIRWEYFYANAVSIVAVLLTQAFVGSNDDASFFMLLMVASALFVMGGLIFLSSIALKRWIYAAPMALFCYIGAEAMLVHAEDFERLHQAAINGSEGFNVAIVMFASALTALLSVKGFIALCIGGRAAVSGEKSGESRGALRG